MRKIEEVRNRSSRQVQNDQIYANRRISVNVTEADEKHSVGMAPQIASNVKGSLLRGVPNFPSHEDNYAYDSRIREMNNAYLMNPSEYKKIKGMFNHENK